MKKIRFRLQSVLKLRQQQEDQKKRVVGAYMAQIHEKQSQALRMADAVARETEILKQQHARGAVDREWVAHYYRFVNHTQNAIAQRVENVIQLQKKLNAARQDLVQAAKQTKILEKLKEKQKKRYDRQLQRIEIFEQNEIGTNIFLRALDSA